MNIIKNIGCIVFVGCIVAMWFPIAYCVWKYNVYRASNVGIDESTAD